MIKKILCAILIAGSLALAHDLRAQAQTAPAASSKEELEKRLKAWSIQMKQRGADENFPELAGTLLQMNVNQELLDSIMRFLPVPEASGFPSDSLYTDVITPLRQLLKRQAVTEREGIVKFGGDVVVGRNELVRGDVVVFGGNADIYGQVNGGAIVVLGDIRLTSTSRVRDDVMVIWGNTHLEDGAQISGKTSVFNFGEVFQNTMRSGFISTVLTLFRFLRIALVFLVFLAVVSAFPDRVEIISALVRQNYIRALLLGFLGLILVPVLFLVLLATILGIPVAVLLLPLAALAAFILGGTSMSLLIGRTIGGKLGKKWPAVLSVALGVIVMEIIPLFRRGAQLFSPVLASSFTIIGILVFITLWLPGFGICITSRFGSSKKTKPAKP